MNIDIVKTTNKLNRSNRGRSISDFDYDCMDCGKNTLKSGEYYMLQDSLWGEICPTDDYWGVLCLSCVEKRLGRILVHSDFKICLATIDHVKTCSTLAQRFYNGFNDG